MTVNIRWIESEADYDAALAEIKRLWGAAPGTAKRNKLEALAMLAHRYERERAPLPRLDPIDAIKFRMEQQGLSRRDLLPVFGTTARISEVLSGKRRLTLEMIRRLHAQLGIPLESLIGPSAERVRAAKHERAAKAARRRAA